MRQGSAGRSTAVLVGLAFIAAGSVGCFAHSRGEQDWDDNPVVNTGAGATILYPGQTGPTYYPNAPGGAAAPQAAPGSGSVGGAPTTQIGMRGCWTGTGRNAIGGKR